MIIPTLKQDLPLVQWSFDNVYLMKLNYGEILTKKRTAFRP